MTIASTSTSRAESAERDLTTVSEPELLAEVRAGDMDAFGELWVRHERVARAVARRSSSSDPDDLVAEAFARILRALRSDAGPTENFRAYLCATVKSCAVDDFRRSRGQVSVEDLEVLSEPETQEFPSDRSDDGLQAWQRLSDAEQVLLWASAVEGYSLGEIADRLEVRPGTVAVRLFRARERLRAAFLDSHVAPSDNVICQQHRERFASYARGTLTVRRRTALEAHLDACADCAAVLAGVGDINRRIRVAILPLLSAEAVRRLIAHGGGHAHHVFLHHAAAQLASVKGAVATVAAVTVTVAAVTGAVVVTHRQGERPAAAAAPVVESSAGPRLRVGLPASAGTPTGTAGTGQTSSAPSTAASTAASTAPAGSASAPAGVLFSAPPGNGSTAGPVAPPVTPTPDAGPTSAATTSAGVTRGGGASSTRPVITNPDFESGSTGWSSSSPASMFWSDGGYAHGGQGYAWIDGQPVPDTETLSQTVTLPAGQRATFTYWLKIATAHASSTPVDTLTLAANGATVQSFSNADACSYALRTVDLSAYAGTSVTLTWTGKQTTSTGTSFFIDDIALSFS